MQSDVVFLHLGLTAETRGFLSPERISAMKPGVILVNTARSGLVDIDGLINGLHTGVIRHAALDVFDPEPLPASHPLTTLPNVTLTAHAAFKTREASRHLIRRAVDLARQDRMAPEAGLALI
jgi:D-3-phosphoglycerate dehydrogenase